MKKNLAHLPGSKREELKRIVDHIRLHSSKTEMIILFGSYARGEWTNDSYKAGHITYEYRSDYDILAVVRDEKTVHDIKRWSQAETAISRDTEIETRVELIPESIEHVNGQLEKGRYFYRDIQKEGVVLYDSGRRKLAKPRELQPKERFRLAEEDYSLWTNKARIALDVYELQVERGEEDAEYLREAAYHLHQTAERLLVAACLVFTNYRPKSHDLEDLIVLMAKHDTRFREVFPEDTQDQRKLFRLLRKAYVDARFEPRTYVITREHLRQLDVSVRSLQGLVARACRQKLDQLISGELGQ